jgi:hypothetical protein
MDHTFSSTRIASLSMGMRIALAMKPGESLDCVTSALSDFMLLWLEDETSGRTLLAGFPKRSCPLQCVL